ncbi:nucleotide disphospho-sugar-binding domain-containing protein [Amycolatopsis sp. NPDC004378]
MRVLFAVSAWPSHFFPMVGLGWALQAAGHDVRVVCAETLTGHVNAAGMTPVPVMATVDMDMVGRMHNVAQVLRGKWHYQHPPLHPVTGAEVDDFSDIDVTAISRDLTRQRLTVGRANADAITEFVTGWSPDLVIHDFLCVDGILAARTAGIPAILHTWGPMGTEEPEISTANGALFFSMLGVNPSLARRGLPRMSFDLIEHVIDPCPPRLRPPLPGNRMPIRYIPYNGAGAQPLWTLEPPARSRIAVIWGQSCFTLFGTRASAFPKALEAVLDLDADFVLTASKADLAEIAGLVDASVQTVTQLPLNLLLPTCDVVIHHGGAGCTMTALTHGVPQLLIPHGLDQEMIGTRVAATGAAISIPSYSASPEKIQQATINLLYDPKYRAAARTLAAEAHDLPAPATVVPALEQLAWTSQRKLGA